MSEDKDKDNLTGHDYDGIQEYDNPLPNWWLMTFFGTIIFAFLYWIHYEFAGGPTLLMELKDDMAVIEAAHHSAGKKGSQDTEESLALLLKDSAFVNKGKDIYQAKCAACHGNELQGLIGPNLVDEYWIHGKGNLKGVIEVVRDGVLDKGMPAWDGMLKDEEIKQVVVFVVSLKGSKPPNPKAPQGEKSVHNSP